MQGTTMPHAASTNPKHCKVFLLGRSALVCLALSTPVMADVFNRTSSDGSTNGVGTIGSGAVGSIAPDAIDGGDTVSLGIALETGTKAGIKTTNLIDVDDGNTVTVSENASITTTGDDSYGIYNGNDDNTTNVSETEHLQRLLITTTHFSWL